VACCRIFTGKIAGCDEPLLVVCEEADLDWIVAFGMFPSDSSAKECFVTVSPNPVKSYPYVEPFARPPFCVCLKYELCPPFPKIKPELNMRIKDTVIVNTGAAVMALHIGSNGKEDTNFASQFGNGSKQCGTRSSDCSELSVGSHCITLQNIIESAPSDVIRLIFVCDDTLTKLSQLIGVVPEPDCVLMFNVYDSQEQEMKPVSADIWNDQCCSDGDIVVPVTQIIFNIDQYLSHALLINKDIAGRVKAVMDYEMEMVDVCMDTKQVVILLKSLVKAVESVDSNGSPLQLYTVNFVLTWNAWTGETKTLDIQSLHETTADRQQRQGLGTLNEAWMMRKYKMVPMTSCRTVRMLSNRTVFTGQSMKYILHPNLPLYIYISPPKEFALD
jgi:hypothetical protein